MAGPLSRYRYDYADFRQACRAFKPSELLPALAATSLSFGLPPYPKSHASRVPPWALAAAARESLLYGNEFRSKAPDDRAIRRLFRGYLDTDVPPDKGDQDWLLRFLTQATYEQFGIQESVFEEVSRPHAWIVEGLDEVETEVLTPSTLRQVLDGLTLRELIGATFLLQVEANENGGRYDPAWLDQENFRRVLELYPRAHVEQVAARLTTTVEGFRADFAAHSTGDPALAKYDYNPLVATPFVDFGFDVPVAPEPSFILRTASASGLYYRGIGALGSGFAKDLGRLFEHYVGRQFGLLAEAEVYPEVVYGGRGGQKRSVDWFVVFPELVLLVEVKCSRLGPGQKAGDPSLFEKLADIISYSRGQLERTIGAIDDGVSEFGHIPTDRPALGLIITAEPFYTAPMYLLDYDLAVLASKKLGQVPVTVASSRELERMISHGPALEGLLQEAIATRGSGVVGFNSFPDPDNENPLLQAAWDSYPWPEGSGDVA